MEQFKLKKPKAPETMDRVLNYFIQNNDLPQYISDVHYPTYLFWDKAQHKPHPEGMSAEEFWACIKLVRQKLLDKAISPVRDENGNYFTITLQLLPGLAHFLHEVDMRLGGALQSGDMDDASTRRRFVSRGIMEEAIASSQLEGANTTRQAAKRMLREKKKPSNHSEQMIVNNHNAMLEVEETLCKEKISVASLKRLHAVLVQDTIVPADVGRFRRDKDKIVVADTASNIVYHTAPPETFLKEEIKRLVKYANDDLIESRFVHPVEKAIILHFWIGYLHPFTDGNGRLARIIFYWYLLRKRYWGFTYLPLSRIIKSSPSQYRMAFTYTEQDDNDLTYFIDYNVRKIRQAQHEFDVYFERKMRENSLMAVLARGKYVLNDRQIQLLRFLHKNSGASTSIKTHALMHTVSRVTARRDLEDLERKGFLSSQKIGRDRPFSATDKTTELFS
ncbi:MAG: Fic family protein [Candidatus Zixiibacteriota bacterium]